MLPFSLEIKSIDHNYFRIWTNRSCWQQFFDFFVSFVFNPFVDLNSCNSVARIIYVKLQILSIKMLFPGFHHFVRWALTRQKLLSLICSKRPDQNQNGQIRILKEPKSARSANSDPAVWIVTAGSEFCAGRFWLVQNSDLDEKYGTASLNYQNKNFLENPFMNWSFDSPKK